MDDRAGIDTACSATIRSIQILSDNVRTTTLLIRDARTDMLELSSELAGLSLSVAFLQDDCRKLPYPESVWSDLVINLQHVLRKCDEATDEASTSIERYNPSQSSTNTRWTSERRDDINRIRTKLESCKRAIAFALMVGNIKFDTLSRVLLNDIEKNTVNHYSITTDAPQQAHEATKAIELTPAVPELIIRDHLAAEPPSDHGDTMKSYFDKMTTLTERVTDANSAAKLNEECIQDLQAELHDDDLLVFESLPSTPVGTSPTQSRLAIQSPLTNQSNSDVLFNEYPAEQTKYSVEVARGRSAIQLMGSPSLEQVTLAQSSDEKAALRSAAASDCPTRLSRATKHVSDLEMTLHRELSRGSHSRHRTSPSGDEIRTGNLSHTQSVDSSPGESKLSTLIAQTSVSPTTSALQIPEMTANHTSYQDPLYISASERLTTSTSPLTTSQDHLGREGAFENLTLSTSSGMLIGIDAALMMEISEHRRPDVVDLLLTGGANASADPAILQQAMLSWSVLIVKQLMARNVRVLSTFNAAAQRSFAIAQRSKESVDVVRFLLDAGIDPNATVEFHLPDYFGPIFSGVDSSENPSKRSDLAALYITLVGKTHTTLSHAIATNQRESVELLLQRGASISRGSLRLASLCGHLDIVKPILSRMIDQGTRVSRGPAIYCAAAVAQRDIVRFLITDRDRADIRHREREKDADTARNPIMTAIRMRQITAAKILVDHGMKIPQTLFSLGLEYALNIEEKNKAKVLFELIIQHGECDREHDRESINRATCAAVQIGSVIATSKLLKVGDPNARDTIRQDLCTQAILARQPDVLKVVLSHKPRKSTTALRIAAKNGEVGMIKMLLDYGINVDTPGASKKTALYLACRDNKLAAVEYLIQRGAQIELKQLPEQPLQAAETTLLNLRSNGKPSEEIISCEAIIALLNKAKSRSSNRALVLGSYQNLSATLSSPSQAELKTEELKPKKRGLFRSSK